MATLEDARSELLRVREALNGFVEGGAELEESLRGVRVAFHVFGRGTQSFDTVGILSPISRIRLNLSRGPFSLELEAPHGGRPELAREAEGDPALSFEGSSLEAALRAREGDVDAALSLEGDWSVVADVDLSAPLRMARPNVAWRAVRNIGVVTSVVTSSSWWQLADIFIDKSGAPVIIVVLGGDGISYQTPTFSVVSLHLIETVDVSGLPHGRRDAVMASSGVRLPEGMLLPEQILPVEDAFGAEELSEALVPRSEALSWAWLSSGLEQDDEIAVVEFFGYRRRRFRVAASGYLAETDQKAYDLYRWATHDESPDKILAVRQVISLHDSDSLPGRPNEVRTAAEPLYRALRASEVATVLESQRQARATAVEAAREAANSAQRAAKSAAERSIASVAAVIGIAVAHATAVLEDRDARWIALAIALVFAFLTIWFLVIEGPALADPIDALKEDLALIGQLLSAEQRSKIIGMQAVRDARRRVLSVRVAVPAVYVVGAFVTLAIASVRFGLSF